MRGPHDLRLIKRCRPSSTVFGAGAVVDALEDIKRDLRTGAERARREASQATRRLVEPPAV